MTPSICSSTSSASSFSILCLKSLYSANFDAAPGEVQDNELDGVKVEAGHQAEVGGKVDQPDELVMAELEDEPIGAWKGDEPIWARKEDKPIVAKQEDELICEVVHDADVGVWN